jgi:hypothetical protein
LTLSRSQQLLLVMHHSSEHLECLGPVPMAESLLNYVPL